MSKTDRTEPYEVCLKGSDKTIGYACPKCHLFCSPLIYACKWEDALKAAYDHALTCCADRLCNDCGENMGPRKGTAWLVCENCRGKRDDERETELFAKATKIPLSEYEGSFLYYDDKFYDDYECFFDDRDDWSRNYAWACYPIDFRMDAASIVESALESGDHHDDAWEEISQRDLDRLQRILDLWCSKVAVRSYMPDFKLAVLLPEDDS